MANHHFLFLLLSVGAFSVKVKPREDSEDYRLPEIYKVTNYQLQLNIAADSLTDESNEFSGTVTINFQFTNLTEVITLHTHHDFITVKSVKFNNIVLQEDDYSVTNATDILKIKLANPISTGRSYILVIEYDGILSTKDMHGFYKSSYIDKNGVTKYLATTQFESTHARKAFPCFDEPQYKATFNVSITYPIGLKAFFNTERLSITSDRVKKLTTETFVTTPKMSTYLVAFIISEFSCTNGTAVDTVTTQVCSREEASATREFALDAGPKILTKLNDFTDYNYNKHITKLDQVAIPDFSAGAMENWGLVTYREASLLWDKDNSANVYKQRVATVIAHELAHQWFGNLVTCKWWSETFLNEGFARYLEYHITHEVYPDWQLDKQFLVENVHSVMNDDALKSSQALLSDCFTPDEIDNKFGTISYAKGGSIVRMIINFIRQDKFKTGIQKYLKDNELTPVEPANLWEALSNGIDNTVSKLPESIDKVMDSWIKKPGYPLLTVKRDENEVTVSQKRFLLSGDDDNTKWYVPISYTSSENSSKIETTTPDVWLTPEKDLTISLSENTKWIVLNNQQTGFYRVNYDESLWGEIGSALLKDDFDGITELNRAQIVDDLFNLGKANQLKYSVVFETSKFLSNDVSYFPWYPAFNGYEFLLKRVGESSELGKAISTSLLTLMDKLYKSVPLTKLNEEDQIYTYKQVLALTWACKLGNEICVEDVKNLFEDYVTNNNRPNKNLRSVVYCNGLRYSNNNNDWEFLWEAYNKSTGLSTEQVTILSALGCSKDTNILKGYLQKLITDASIRLQDIPSAYASVYKQNTEGVTVAFDFLIDNYKEIEDKLQSSRSFGKIITGIAEMLTTNDELTKLKKFVESADLSESAIIAANEAIETVERNMNWLTQFEKDLKTYYNINSASKAGVSMIVVLLVLMFNKLLLH